MKIVRHSFPVTSRGWDRSARASLSCLSPMAAGKEGMEARTGGRWEGEGEARGAAWELNKSS